MFDESIEVLARRGRGAEALMNGCHRGGRAHFKKLRCKSIHAVGHTLGLAITQGIDGRQGTLRAFELRLDSGD